MSKRHRGDVLFEVRISPRVLWRAALLGLLLALTGVVGISQVSQALNPMGLSSLLPFSEPKNSPLAFEDETGLGTELLGVADFNEDGFVDLVGSSKKSLQILLGDGQGKFSVGSVVLINSVLQIIGDTQVSRPVEDEFFSSMDTEIVDFNEDGHLDVVLLGTVLINTVHSPTDDGLDVPSQKRLYVFLGDGQGQLRLAFKPIVFNEDGLDFASKIVAADVSGDGIKDVLLIALGQHFVNAGNTNPFTLFPGVGQGKLGDSEVPDFEFLPFSAGIKQAITKDFNQDGSTDIFLRFDHEVGLLQGGAKGGFTFQKLVTTAEDSFIGRVFLSDVNNDGITELGVVINQVELQIFSLDPKGPVLLGSQTSQVPLNQVFTGDLNADQIPDLLTTGFDPQVFSIALGDGRGGFDLEHPVQYALRTALQNVFIDDLTLNGRNDLLFSTPFVPLMLLNQGQPQGVTQIPMTQSLLLGHVDVDADRDVDFIGGVGQQLEAFINNGQGVLTTTPLALSTSSFLTRGVPLDLDEDGRDEFLILGIRKSVPSFIPGNPGTPPATVLSVLGPDETGQFGERAVFTFEYDGGMPNLEVGDFNGDGHLDVLTTGKQSLVLWVGDGNGQLAPQRFAVDGQVGVVAAQDVDQDGNSEIIAVVTQDTVTFKLFGWQQDRLVEIKTLATTQTTPLLLKRSDFNTDGFEDLLAIGVEMNAVQQEQDVVIEIPGARLIEFLHEGQGGFQVIEIPIGRWDLGTVPWPVTGLAIGEFNQDSSQDIAFTMQQGAPVRVLTEAANGDLATEANVPCQGAPLFVADLDGNGKEELVTSTVGFPTLCIAWNAGGLR